MKGVSSMKGPFLAQSQMINDLRYVGTIFLSSMGCIRLIFVVISGTLSCLMKFVGMLDPLLACVV
jgi:hypothetical protein